MEFTLKLFFTGLLAFVPVDESGKVVDPGSAKAVWVLALDENPPSPGYDEAGELLDPHFVALRFAAENHRFSRLPVACVRNVDVPCQGRDNPFVTKAGYVEDCRVLTLDTEDLIAFGGAKSTPSNLAVNAANFNDLISLKEVYSKTAIDPLLWQGPLSSPLAARLKIENGTLEQWQRVTHDGDEIDVCFDPKENWPRDRKATSRLLLKITGLKDTVTFRSARGDIVLGPAAGCKADCVVEVEMLNSPFYEVLNPCAKHQSKSERHFELYWGLSSFLPAVRPAPNVSPCDTPPPPTVDLLCPEVRP